MSDGTFIDALKVPAIISTLRKIQVDSGESLRVLNGYFSRNRHMSNETPLTPREDAALDDILLIAVEQTLGALFLFSLANIAFALGGVIAGQCMQVFISANTLMAPRQQIVHPGRHITQTLRQGLGFEFCAPAASRPKLAFLFGGLAQATGYHAGTVESDVRVTDAANRREIAGTPLIRFLAFPDFGPVVERKMNQV